MPQKNSAAVRMPHRDSVVSATTPIATSGSERLSPLDASFLYLERPTELLHVGAVAVLETAPPFAELVDVLGARLGALRRYRQVPVRPALDLAPPRWVDDPHFDPRRHIHRVVVPAPGDEAAFRCVLEETFARPLPPEQPLWECHLFEGLAGGRAALLTKVHHCMIDGVSGVQVLEVMSDGWEPRNDKDGGAAETRSVVDRARDLAVGAARALDPGRLTAELRGTAAAAGTLVNLVRARLRPYSFNGSLGHTRRIVWQTFDLDEFLAMRGVAGCKVNDVALAVITGALRRLLPAEATESGRRVRALIPMNVRRDDEHLMLGNRVSGMFATLPIDVADARERLHLIAAEMRASKEAGQARAFDLALGVVGAMPTAVASLVSRLAQVWPVAHTVCTNVPGPREPRALLGRQVVALHPMVPLAAGIGLGFAILSYAGKLSITATADATLVPDADRLPAALQAAADELACHLGLRAEATVAPVERGSALTVGDLMTRDVVTVRPTDLLSSCWATMRERRIRHLPVVDRHGVLCGLVSHRDVLAASPSSLSLRAETDRTRALGWTAVGDVMEMHVSTAAAPEAAADAGLRMVRQKISCLPVVDARGALVGIVTEEDFVRWSAEQMGAAARRPV
jgi:diacylglycerol O-acyltransferase / wax synthase